MIYKHINENQYYILIEDYGDRIKAINLFKSRDRWWAVPINTPKENLIENPKIPKDLQPLIDIILGMRGKDPETIMKRINTPQSLHSGFQTQKIF